MGVNNLKSTFISTKKGCSCNKFCIQEYCDKLFDQTFVSVWRHIFLRAVSTEMLSLFIYFIPEKTLQKSNFLLGGGSGFSRGSQSCCQALVGGVVCWAKLGSSTGVSKSRYEDEEVLLLHKALVTQLTFLLGRIPFLMVRNILVCLLGPL